MTQPPGIVVQGRRLIEATLLDRAVVLDRTVVRDAGGSRETFVARATPLACGFGSVNDREATQAQGLVGTRAASAVSFPVETVLAEGTRLRNVVSNRLWTIVGSLTPESNYATVARFLIREV